ncbi:MAG: NUDIX hydrolase [Candidatus Paceibacterota bacterium]|jgi:ADP-ribose pyrophosphatase
MIKLNKKHGPWTIKTSQIKYKNPWITVREDKVVQPSGKSGIFGTVTLQKGISVLPLDDQGFVYLTQEFHYASGKNSLETVSGAVENTETYLDAAKRELKEELGVEAREWINLGRVDPLTTTVKAPAQIFLAKDLAFKDSQQDETELIKMVKVKLDKAVDMVIKSKITHAQSCVLILKAKLYLDINK